MKRLAAFFARLRYRPPADPAARSTVLVVGSPNVGKSLLFNRLTGEYVTVSNYPGTTVEIARGRLRGSHGQTELIDTPGIYSLSPITDEERVTCAFLLERRPHAIVHVVDTKNLDRMLGLTLQLIETGLPVILALNMADEAAALGIEVDLQSLERQLGVPVVRTVATTGEGVRALIHAIEKAQPGPGRPAAYGPVLDPTIATITQWLGESSSTISPRTRAVLLLLDDGSPDSPLLHGIGAATAGRILTLISETLPKLDHSAHYYLTLSLKEAADRIAATTFRRVPASMRGFREALSRALMSPITGLPVLLLVLYFGLYKFVGSFGAGTLVDWIEDGLFVNRLNPWSEHWVAVLIPWTTLQQLFVGPYGILTLGVRYAVAIVMPIVGTFFIAFSILEDSGYLPRLAMLMDRLFKALGLNGRAVIPMVLGFGCGTMATMVTRTLETRREKLIATLLLALAIPCSAQVGVVMGLLAGRPAALLVWASVVGAVFLVAGCLAARLFPGDRPSFYMELPPLRLPRPDNVAVKTLSRMAWYFREVFPLFILASVILWIGSITGLFDLALRALTPAVRLLGLPDEGAVAFLFGFFRRDYGAAGLYDLQKAGIMNGNQLTVAAITLTLFLPCIAQVLIMKKERGGAFTLWTVLGVSVIAYTTGLLTHVALVLTGVVL